MSISHPEEIDYHEITDSEQVPFEKDPRDKNKFGGAVEGVVPTERFASKFHTQDYVQKTIRLNLSETGQEDDARSRRLFQQEVKNLNHARHQHVVKITTTYFFRDPNEAYFAIIMPRADGNLRDFIKHVASGHGRKKELIARWFGCLANVTEHIHGIGIRHRDVKPENILYKQESILFADFGISKMGLGQTLSTTVPQWMSTSTPKYVAPEVGAGGTRGRSADIFSLGTVFLEMLLAHSYQGELSNLGNIISLRSEMPGGGEQSYSKKLAEVRSHMEKLQKEIRSDEKHWQKAMFGLCGEMLDEDRDKRPSAEQVYSVISSLPKSHDSPRPCGCVDQEAYSEAQKLVNACKRRDGLQEVQALLTANTANTIGAIHQAATHGFKAVVELFLERGVDVNLTDHSGQTALHCAAGYGHGQVVELLLQNDAKVDIKDEEEQRPIHCASGQKRLEVLKMLLRHDTDSASVMAQNIYGQTALHSAARKGAVEVVKVLLQKMDSASLATSDNNKRTALHLAAGCGSNEVVQMLFPALVPETVDLQDKNGWTALHFAARGQQTSGQYRDVVQFLVSKGANVTITDSNGRSPYYYAHNNNQPEIAQLLRDSDDARDDIKQLEQELAKILQPTRNYSDAEIQKVSDRIRATQLPWQPVTKIIMVLHIIGLRSNMLRVIIDRFLKDSIIDFDLPFNESHLSHILAPSTCAQFLEVQKNVLTEILDFEKHGNLHTDAWPSDWQEIKILGTGNSGKVHKVRRSNTDDVFALKLIHRGPKDDGKRGRQELNLLKRVVHHHIISLVGSFTSPSFFGILMTPATEYNLDQYLSEAVTHPDKRQCLWGYFGCLINALCHLHNTVYIRHNDIKPQNILVDGTRVLLTDFGISLDWSETLRTTTFGAAAMTPMYSAPETTDEDRSRNTFSDIWSLGCVFLEMITVLKQRTVQELRQYLTGNPATSSAYSRNLPFIRRWIVILGTNLYGVEKRFLELIDHMLAEHPQSRPFAAKVRRDILAFDSDSEKSFFGDCCRTKSRTEKDRDATTPQDEVIEEFPIEQHTSIAAVSWPGEQRLYVQGTNGTIRQAFRREDQLWKGGKEENDTIATGKLCTPIAATAWQHKTGHRQPTIRVYFLDEDNYIRERTWDPMSGWADGALPRRFKAAPLSQLTITSWDEGNIILFYQTEDDDVQLLHGWAKEERWEQGFPLVGASPGSTLSALSFEHYGNRGVRLYFKSKHSMFQETCWDKIEDERRNDKEWYLGGYRFPSSMGSFVSGISWKEEDLEMRLYLGGQDGIFEQRYHAGWPPWKKRLDDLFPEGPIAVLRGDSGSINIYFVQGEGLVEAQRSRGCTTDTRILPKMACSGAECPGIIGRQVINTPELGPTNQPRPASATEGVNAQQADGIEPQGQETSGSNGNEHDYGSAGVRGGQVFNVESSDGTKAEPRNTGRRPQEEQPSANTPATNVGPQQRNDNELKRGESRWMRFKWRWKGRFSKLRKRKSPGT